MHKTKLGLSVPAAFILLTACATDGHKPVQPPIVTALPAKPSDATIAWAKLAVTDALAAEKTGRDKGASDNDIVAGIVQTIVNDVAKPVPQGMPGPDIRVGLQWALADPANTPLTHQAFDVVLSTTGGSYGSCRICK